MTYIGRSLPDMPDASWFVPKRYRPAAAAPAVLTEAELEAESKAAWQLMNQFFRGGHHNGR